MHLVWRPEVDERHVAPAARRRERNGRAHRPFAEHDAGLMMLSWPGTFDRQINTKQCLLRSIHAMVWNAIKPTVLLPVLLVCRRLARVELARATGGGPPKKGQGKRAKK